MRYDEFLTSLIQEAMSDLMSLKRISSAHRVAMWGLVTPLVCLGLSATGWAQGAPYGEPQPQYGRQAAPQRPGYPYQSWPYRAGAQPNAQPQPGAPGPQRGLYQYQQVPQGGPPQGYAPPGGNPNVDPRRSSGGNGQAGLIGPGQPSYRDLPSQPAAAGSTLTPRPLYELAPSMDPRGQQEGQQQGHSHSHGQPHSHAAPAIESPAGGGLELAAPHAALQVVPVVCQLGSRGTCVVQVRNTGVGAATGLMLEVESTPALPLGAVGQLASASASRGAVEADVPRRVSIPVNNLSFGESRDIVVPIDGQTLGDHVVRCTIVAGGQQLDAVSGTVRVIPRHLEFELVAANHRLTDSPLGSTIRVKNVTSQPITKIGVKLAFDEAFDVTRPGAARLLEPGLLEWRIEQLQPGEVAWLPAEFVGRRASQESCLRATLSRNDIPLDQIDHAVTLADERLPMTLDILDRNEPSAAESSRSVVLVVRNHGFEPTRPAVGIMIPAGWRLAGVTDPKPSRRWQVKSRAGELVLIPSTTVEPGEAAVIGLDLIPHAPGNASLTGRLYLDARSVMGQGQGAVAPDLEVEEQLAVHAATR
jgi:hypothetical protein